MIGRRRPLLRAAAVGGGAYALGKRRARREQEEADAYYEQGANDAGAGNSGSGGGLSDADLNELEKLAKLKDAGVLTPEEFTTQKEKILAGS